MEGMVNEKLMTDLEENPAVGAPFFDKAITAQRAREAARRAKGVDPAQIGAETPLPLPASWRIAKKRTLMSLKFTSLRADSAGGSAKQGRDRLSGHLAALGQDAQRREGAD